MSGASLTIAPQDRLMRALRGIIRQQLARLFTYGMYEYSVTTSDGTTVDMTPIDTTIPLPGLTGIPLRLCGMTAKPAAGQKVILAFLNGDPSRPIVLSNDPKPTTAAIDASSSLTLGGSSGTVAIGSSASAITMGPLPLPLASAMPLTTVLAAINTAFGSILTYAGAIKSVADPSGAATTALGSAMGTVSGAIGTAVGAIPTTVVKGT